MRRTNDLSKKKYFYFILLPILFFHVSCTRLIYGTSTEITLDSDNRDERVSLVAIGSKTIAEYNDVAFPFNVKVKHSELPLTVIAKSDTTFYDNCEIIGKSKSLEGTIYAGIGAAVTIVGLGTAAIMGASGSDNTAPPALASLGGLGLMGVGFLTMTEIPEYKYYRINKSDKDGSLEIENVFRYSPDKNYRDAGYYMGMKNYEMAAKKFTSIMKYENVPELYLYRGYCNLHSYSTKKAIKDFNYLLSQRSLTEELHKKARALMEEAKSQRAKEKAENAKDWAEFGAILLGSSLNF